MTMKITHFEFTIFLGFFLAGLLSAQTGTPVPGKRYFGTDGYIEYVGGDLPIVLSAPHGGYLRPSGIPDRTWGIISQDRNTQELSREIYQAIVNATGHFPHLVINHLHRIKLDANRDIKEAAQGNKQAERAWREFHAFINWAKNTVIRVYGKGHYVDIHAHRHPVDWLELGYGLYSWDLKLSDKKLRDPGIIKRSTLRNLGLGPGVDFPELLRGWSSLGGLLVKAGYRAVPSPKDPNPGGNPYFRGGYNVLRHGSMNGGTIDGTQIEHKNRMIDTVTKRSVYASSLASCFKAFFTKYYNINLAYDPKVTVRAASPFCPEGGGKAVFRFSRTGNTASSLKVTFEVVGSAREGLDYKALPRSVVIPSGHSYVDLSLEPIDDNLLEGRETVVIRITMGKEAGYPNVASAVILDDEGNEDLCLYLPLETMDSGKTRDFSGRSRDGVLNPPGSGGPSLVAGRYLNALHFDGRDDHLRIKDFDYAITGEFTLSFWFRANKRGGNSYKYLFSHGSVGNAGTVNIYFIENTGFLRTWIAFNNNLAAKNVLDISRNLMDGKWHLYCLAAEAKGISRIFVDGRPEARAFYDGDKLDPRGDLFIGARNDLDRNRFYCGDLDDLRILKRAITREEAEMLYSFAQGRLKSFGRGCKGSGGKPARIAVESPYEAGWNIYIMGKDLKPNSISIFLVGFSNTGWNGARLPFDMSRLGAPGCRLYVSGDIPRAAPTTGTGSSRMRILVPPGSIFIHEKFYAQVLCLDPGANNLGTAFSNALEVDLGGVR